MTSSNWLFLVDLVDLVDLVNNLTDLDDLADLTDLVDLVDHVDLVCPGNSDYLVDLVNLAKAFDLFKLSSWSRRFR